MRTALLQLISPLFSLSASTEPHLQSRGKKFSVRTSGGGRAQFRGSEVGRAGDLFMGATLDEQRNEVADGRSVVSVIRSVDHVGDRLLSGLRVSGDEAVDDLIDQQLLFFVRDHGSQSNGRCEVVATALLPFAKRSHAVCVLFALNGSVTRTQLPVDD